MRILPDVALTYDDVLLVPQHSDVVTLFYFIRCSIQG